MATSAHAQSFTVQWDHPADPDAVGYVIFIGTSPGQYDYQRDVLRGTQFIYSAPAYGTYYVALKSYNAGAQLGPFSAEVSATIVPPAYEYCNPDGSGNGVDEDGDGLIDEVCSMPPPPPPPPPAPTTGCDTGGTLYATGTVSTTTIPSGQANKFIRARESEGWVLLSERRARGIATITMQCQR